VFPGNELFLPRAMPLGAAGTITGSANIAARYIRAAYNELLDTGRDGPAQQRAWAIREAIDRFGHLQSQKFLLARSTGNPSWERLAPPLTALDDRDGSAFLQSFDLARR
jgi:dihydrodipicolinate synthase/N-acetylneuraminate lyase